ncbi:MAG: PAS domain S-box protein [Nitrospirales bacterium]|nr:PAS domain S-box protein [Nitrospira sp.]MDR4502831.1 PAS domain S-box protein [Nitrospirales bacterium]
MNSLTTLSKDQYRLLVEQIPAITYTARIEWGKIAFNYVSPQLETVLGFHPSEWINNPNLFLKHIHPDDRERVGNEHRERLESHEPVQMEYRILSNDGRMVWIRDVASIVREADGVSVNLVGVFHDVTEKKRLEDELSRWDEETRALTTHHPDIIARLDGQGRVLYLNRWLDFCHPMNPESYLGKTLEELEMPDALSNAWSKACARVRFEETPSLLEFSCFLNNDQKIFESRFIPEFGRTGRVKTVLIITRDLTQKKSAECALRESEERFRQLAESITDVFWLVDARTEKFLYVSPAYEKSWGACSLQLLENSRAWLSTIHPEDRTKIEKTFFEKVVNGTLDIEYRVLHHDGNVRWIHNRAFPITNDAGEIFRVAGMAEDITIRKQFEEERLRMSKLDSLGLLAGGLAHDFNNLLTAILGQLSLAKFFIASDNPLFQRLNEAELASMRAQDLTQQLLTFAKGGTPIRKPASLSQIVEENTHFVLTGSNIKSELHIVKELWTVDVDVGQISQVIQNLVINAMQAMPSGGTLTVFGQNLTVTEEERAGHCQVSSGNWVKVSFIDQGIGIPKMHLSKIFDPYFTTKASGHGLGLATSYSIIKNHGGDLTVDSEVGIGTTFTVLLPASIESRVISPRRDAPIQQGQGTILVMDDEAPIRKVLCEMLEVCGYGYQTAKNSHETLELFCEAKKNGTPFDAVILDLTIPGEMGGRIVIQKLLEIDPSVKAIVVSGYSNDPVLSNFKEYGFQGRIPKPFRLNEVSDAIQQVLNK